MQVRAELVTMPYVSLWKADVDIALYPPAERMNRRTQEPLVGQEFAQLGIYRFREMKRGKTMTGFRYF